jgi:dephospho-CoA kinase
MLEAQGVVVIESDRIGHAVLEPDGPAFAAVAAEWPEAVSAGRIDRAALAGIVFSDHEELERLEELTHPHIAAEIVRRVADAGDVPVAVELPVAADLVGDGWVEVLVDAPDDVRLSRALDRGIGEVDARHRMASQPTRAEWLGRAHRVISNDGSLDGLARQVEALWRDVSGDA